MAVGTKVAAGVPALRAVGVRGGVYPPLKIEVVEAGKVVRVIEVPDPREKFIKAWNALSP